ncbi:hypothetical protein BSLG_005204 [Batrachochytrium salamandrivorans]|nr:hypothetical protein BSLG_005204 [Batrachochytrium salamandrivorans]
MFFLKQLTHTINLHPQFFGPQIKAFLTRRLYEEVEGTCSGQFGYIISVVDIVDVGKGVLQSNTGFAQFQVLYKAIVFKPFKNQVVDGIVTTVNKIGFWADVGPLQVFISSHLIPGYLKFDSNSNPPAYVGEGQEFGEASLRVEKGATVRLRIVGTRVDATEIVSDESVHRGTDAAPLDGGLQHVAPAVRTQPLAGRRARGPGHAHDMLFSDGPTVATHDDYNASGGGALNPNGHFKSNGSLFKGNAVSNENVSQILGPVDPLNMQVDTEEESAIMTATRKSRFRVSIDNILPKFGLSTILKQDSGSIGKLDRATLQSPLTLSEGPIPSYPSILASSEDVDSESRDSASKRGRRSVNHGAVLTLNGDIDDEKEKKDDCHWSRNAYGATSRNTDSGDQVIVTIPDLMDVEDEDISTTIAVAPIVEPKAMKTISEIENDISQNDEIAKQLQHLSVPGLDLSLLIHSAFCPPAHLDEPDQPWNWDVLFTQVSSDIQADNEIADTKAASLPPLLPPNMSISSTMVSM